MNDVKLFLESCQSLVLYALVALSLGVLTASSAVALMKSVKLSAVKICRYGFLGVFFMSVMFGIGVSIGSVKVPGDPTNQVQQGQVSGPLRSGGSQVQITDEDITNCWRVARPGDVLAVTKTVLWRDASVGYSNWMECEGDVWGIRAIQGDVNCIQRFYGDDWPRHCKREEIRAHDYSRHQQRMRA